MKGDIVRRLRENEKLTQSELGEKIGIAGSTIRMIELGKREGTKKNIQLIADYFGVSVDYIEGREYNTTSELEKFVGALAAKNVDIQNPQVQDLILHYVEEEIKRIQNKKAQD